MVSRSGPRLATVVLVATALAALALAPGVGAKEPLRDPDTLLRKVPLEAAAADVSFNGQILVADPSKTAFGPDPLLWRESCHHLGIPAGGARTGTLSLESGATDGALEDLDIYLYDAAGTLLLEDSTESHGIGVHHTVLVPSSTTDGYVCLSNGARAEYEFVLT